LDLPVIPAGVQGVEVRDAIDAKDYGLAVEHKLPDAVLQGGFGDPGISLRPVIAAAGDQADAVARGWLNHGEKHFAEAMRLLCRKGGPLADHTTKEIALPDLESLVG
jgi:hypothetical protein